jgi:hypothetical protein
MDATVHSALALARRVAPQPGVAAVILAPRRHLLYEHLWHRYGLLTLVIPTILSFGTSTMSANKFPVGGDKAFFVTNEVIQEQQNNKYFW